jgi:hypothetical protein
MIGNAIAGIFSVASAPVAATSYESIATATGTGSSGTITFSSIPSTFKHLQVRFNAMGTSTSARIYMRFNSDTGSNYNTHCLIGDGSSAFATNYSATQMTIAQDGYGINTTYPTVGIVDVLDYTSTVKNKTIRVLTGMDKNASLGEVGLYSGLWRNTSAVNEITVRFDAGNFTTAAQFSLYGIKGA